MEIRDKIRQIKYSRLPEMNKFFLKLIKGVKRIKDDDNKYYWVNNKSIIFEERIEPNILIFSRSLYIILNNKYGSELHFSKLSHDHLVNKKCKIMINTDRGEEAWDIIERKYDKR